MLAKILFYKILAILLCGCGRDERLYTFGTFSFTVFLFMFASLFIIKYAHKNNYLIGIIEKATPFARLLSKFFRAIALFIMLLGALLLFDSKNYPEKLTFFLGVVIYVMGHFLGKWASDSVEKKAENWRYVSLSFGFAAVMLYLILGADGIK